MTVELPPLPWAENALEPDYSARTVSFHYGKHHKAYVDKFNELSAGTPYADMKLEDAIRDTAGKADKAGLFNNAAQVWNHTFFWDSMKPGGGGKPEGEPARLAGAVPSPMVGTTYRSSSPGSKPFVEVGDAVKKGQTILIIEAMKHMNEVPSPHAGTVTSILVEDGQPVEFGEPLMIIA